MRFGGSGNDVRMPGAGAGKAGGKGFEMSGWGCTMMILFAFFLVGAIARSRAVEVSYGADGDG